jgi:sulfoacetaldehyde acetyltransferase
MPRISGSEAMVEALRKENVEYVMGIVGSAFMDPLDLFPEAGIRFIQVRHEQSASLMAEGYARITGRPGVCIGQNGPGITNLVTGIASAQLNHSPVVALTPAVIASGIGTKAFQEIDQMRLLAPIVAWQLQVNRPERMSEGIRGAFRAALALRGPAQVDIPRDSYYAEWEETPLDPPSYRTAGRLGGADEEDLQRAVQAITGAKKIAILAGLGAVESDAQADIDRLAELLNSPVATVWQHNDAIFNSRPLSTGSIGYQGSQAAMRLVADADVVIALGTRLNAFGTTPQWGLDFWPKSAKLIHNSMNPLDIGALRPVHAGLVGDCRAVVRQLIAALQDQPLAVDGAARRAQVAQEKQRWAAALREMSAIGGDKIQPRRAMWEISQALQGDVAIVADVGNISGSANAYFDRFDTSRRWFGAGSLGGIGVSYPTALGCQARPARLARGGAGGRRRLEHDHAGGDDRRARTAQRLRRDPEQPGLRRRASQPVRFLRRALLLHRPAEPVVRRHRSPHGRLRGVGRQGRGHRPGNHRRAEGRPALGGGGAHRPRRAERTLPPRRAEDADACDRQVPQVRRARSTVSASVVVSPHDYVIVGAGPAGCVLAHRLSADPQVSVLLLEAGEHDGGLWSRVPLGVGRILNDESRTWPLTTEPVPHAGGVAREWVSGRCLAGPAPSMALWWCGVTRAATTTGLRKAARAGRTKTACLTSAGWSIGRARRRRAAGKAGR